MTEDEIKELRNDLVLLSVAINQMEKRMREGFFNNAITIARENMDIVNKYNPIDDWLWIKRDDLDCLNKALADYEISSSYKELVKNTHRMRLIIDTCFHITRGYRKTTQTNETKYEFPYVGFLCRMCSSRLTLVGSDKDCLTFECNHCPFEGRISIPHSEYKEVNWTNIKL